MFDSYFVFSNWLRRFNEKWLKLHLNVKQVVLFSAWSLINFLCKGRHKKISAFLVVRPLRVGEVAPWTSNKKISTNKPGGGGSPDLVVRPLKNHLFYLVCLPLIASASTSANLNSNLTLDFFPSNIFISRHLTT